MIAIRGLERAYGRTRVLRGVDLDVGRGEAVALFGSNGAGKTTLLRVIAGMARPECGEVIVMGEKMPCGTALRRQLGFVGHETFLYADLTGAENLRYYARLYDADHERVATLLREVELESVADRPARTYSRGMAQRLSLARALLHEPRLLLLDEPFTGLDPRGTEILIRQLDAARSNGTTIFLTTHDFAIGLEIGDRAILLHDGRIAWESGAKKPDPIEMKAIYVATIARR